MDFWLGDDGNEIMKKDALIRDTMVSVSPSPSSINRQSNIGTGMQTDMFNHGASDLCSTVSSRMVHEKDQEKGLLLDGDEKTYSVLGPQDDDIANFYTLSKAFGANLSDGRVFTLKPEYRKDKTLDEKKSSGSGILKINGLWCRVILPNDSNVHSLLCNEESKDHSVFLESPVSVNTSTFLQNSNNMNIVKPSSKVGRTLYVAFNHQPMTPDEARMKFIPSIKVRNLTKYSGQWPFHTPISSTEEPCDRNVVNKRKSTSTVNSHVIKATMSKKQKYSDFIPLRHIKMECDSSARKTSDSKRGSRDSNLLFDESDTKDRSTADLSENDSQSSSRCSYKGNAFWSIREEEALKKRAIKVENGVTSLDATADPIRRVGRKRTARAVKYRTTKKLCGSPARKETHSKRGLRVISPFEKSDAEDWSTATLSDIQMESSSRCIYKGYAFWTKREEETLKKWVIKVEKNLASWKDVTAAVSFVGSNRSIKACQQKYFSMRKELDSSAKKKTYSNSGTRGSNFCIKPGPKHWSTANPSDNESESSFHDCKARWTAMEEQKLKKCAIKVKNGVASWADAAVAISCAGSERTVEARKKKYSFMQKIELDSPGGNSLEWKSEIRGSDASGTEGWSMAKLPQNNLSFHDCSGKRAYWTTKEEQTLKKWATKVKKDTASWDDVAAAVSSAGSERTTTACQRKYQKMQNNVSVSLTKKNLKVHRLIGERNPCSEMETEVCSKADIIEIESAISNPVDSRSTTSLFSKLTSWIPKLFSAN